MRMRDRRVARVKLDVEMWPFRKAGREKEPTNELLRAVRQSLGIPIKEITKEMGVGRSAVFDLEMNERKKTITLRSLDRMAEAMGCKVVYGVVPMDGGTLEHMAEERLWKEVLGERGAREHENEGAGTEGPREQGNEGTRDQGNERARDTLWEQEVGAGNEESAGRWMVSVAERKNGNGSAGTEEEKEGEEKGGGQRDRAGEECRAGEARSREWRRAAEEGREQAGGTEKLGAGRVADEQSSGG